MNTKPTPSDTEVLHSSQTRPWMFGILVERYQEPFLRKGTHILHSREAAEDAAQETFMKIYKYAHRFAEQDGASFQSWAYKILTNTCYTHLTRNNKDYVQVKALDFADLDVAGPLRAEDGREQASFVQSVLSRMPKNLSRLLHLYFFEDNSYEEIAIAEDISLSAVRSGLHRAKKQFKNIAIKIV